MRARAFAGAVLLVYGYATVHLFPSPSVLPMLCLAGTGVVLLPTLVRSISAADGHGRPRRYLAILFVASAWMTVTAVISVLGGVGSYTISALLVDLISVCALSSGYLICAEQSRAVKYFSNYVAAVVAVAVVSGLFALALADFGAGRLGNVWTPQYILWGFLFPWSWMLLLLLTRRTSRPWLVVLGVGMTACYFLLGFLFGKRVVVYEAVIYAAVSLVLVFRFGGSVLRRVLVLAMGLLLAIFVMVICFPGVNSLALVDLTISRFGNGEEGDSARVTEFTDMLQQYSSLTPIVGAGFGSTQLGPGGINLHIGWLNFAFKGGLVLIAAEAWVFILAIKLLLTSRDRVTVWIAGCTAAMYFTIFVSSAWVVSPLVIGQSVLKFMLLSRADEEWGPPRRHNERVRSSIIPV